MLDFAANDPMYNEQVMRPLWNQYENRWMIVKYKGGLVDSHAEPDYQLLYYMARYHVCNTYPWGKQDKNTCNVDKHKKFIPSLWKICTHLISISSTNSESNMIKT